MDYQHTLHDIHIDSNAVQRKMRVCIITPPVSDPRRPILYPVLYFLHPWGLGPDYITDKLKIHEHLWNGVQKGALPPFVIVLPTGFRSFFLNAADPPGYDWTPVIQGNEEFFGDALDQYGRYGDYLLREVLPFVEQHYPVRTDRAGRALGGISMGGASAAVHAFKYPNLFSAVGIHSPALFDGPPVNNGPPWIFGLDRASFALRNPADIASHMCPNTQPRILLDTGDRDTMRDQVEHLHHTLTAHGLMHEYAMLPGGHNKSFWEPRIRTWLAFYARDWH